MTEQKQGTVITFGNLKGGTGKTTSSVMIAYALSEMGYKVLLIDQDPQANASNLYLKTKSASTGEKLRFNKTLMAAIEDEDLASIVFPVKENLYLLPSFTDFIDYPDFLYDKFPTKSDRVQYLETLLRPLKKEYDFLIIDVPPTASLITDSALYASDYVVVVLQTQERSLHGAEVFVKYLQSLVDDYGASLNTIGILPVLMKHDGLVDLATLESAKELFGEEHFFRNVVKEMARLKRFATTGITDNDMHDTRVHELYKNVAAEVISRLNAQQKMERNISQQSSPANQFKPENMETNYKEPEKKHSLKKELISDKTTTTFRKKISHQKKLNALVFLNKADTTDDLRDFMLEDYLQTHVTEDEKKKFDTLMEL